MPYPAHREGRVNSVLPASWGIWQTFYAPGKVRILQFKKTYITIHEADTSDLTFIYKNVH